MKTGELVQLLKLGTISSLAHSNIDRSKWVGGEGGNLMLKLVSRFFRFCNFVWFLKVLASFSVCCIMFQLALMGQPIG